MVPFKQPILPGEVGSEVLAVKHVLRRMGIKGASAMNMSRLQTCSQLASRAPEESADSG